MQSFSFSTPINLVGQGKWLLGVFNITNENNSFSMTIPGQWNSECAKKTIEELNNLLDFKCQNSIELHMKKVRKKEIK